MANLIRISRVKMATNDSDRIKNISKINENIKLYINRTNQFSLG